MRTFVVAWRGLAAAARGFPKTMDFGFDAGAACPVALAEIVLRDRLIAFFAFAGFALGFCLLVVFAAIHISILYAILSAIYC